MLLPEQYNRNSQVKGVIVFTFQADIPILWSPSLHAMSSWLHSDGFSYFSDLFIWVNRAHLSETSTEERTATPGVSKIETEPDQGRQGSLFVLPAGVRCRSFFATHQHPGAFQFHIQDKEKRGWRLTPRDQIPESHINYQETPAKLKCFCLLLLLFLRISDAQWLLITSRFQFYPSGLCYKSFSVVKIAVATENVSS